MSKSRTIGIAALCAAVGAAGGIAGTAASSKRHSKRSTAGAPSAPWDHHRGGPGGGPAVHAEEVVLDKAGKNWITETEDNGKVKSVSGNDVTITEGTTDVPYKDVTVTVPDGATVVRDGAKAAVGDLKAGDMVHVSSSSDGTFVFAADASWRPPGPWGHGDGDHGHGPPPGGPPPGAPGTAPSGGWR